MKRQISARPGKLSKRLHPRLAKWFHEAFGDFTQAQLLCVPAILDRQYPASAIERIYREMYAKVESAAAATNQTE